MNEEPRRVGDYEILSVLGSGGMGKVFKVRNVISDRVEAMKVLLPDLAGRQEVAQRFLREIKLLAGFSHPNIASLRTALTLNNQLVMVMEYVEGTTLAARLEAGPVSLGDALKYTDQVLDALAYAHSQGIIHRDIKPANIMLTPDGVVKVMDFGIARTETDRGLTATGTTLGSLYYMPPEQIKGEKADARADLYSLGVMLYEMVSGQRPFQADSDFSIMAAHLQQTPKPPIELQASLPSQLNAIILMAIAKEPSQRFQSAAAMRNALSTVKLSPAAAAAVPQPAAPVSPAMSATSVLQGTDAAPTISGPLPVAVAVAAAPAYATPQPPPAAQQPAAMSSAATPARSGNRGSYMVLGAILAIAVIVVAAMYLPRHFGTQATSSASQPASETPKPGTTNPQPTESGSAGSSAGAASSAPASPAMPAAPAAPAPGTAPMSSASASTAGGASSGRPPGNSSHRGGAAIPGQAPPASADAAATPLRVPMTTAASMGLRPPARKSWTSWKSRPTSSQAARGRSMEVSTICGVSRKRWAWG